MVTVAITEQHYYVTDFKELWFFRFLVGNRGDGSGENRHMRISCTELRLELYDGAELNRCNTLL